MNRLQAFTFLVGIALIALVIDAGFDRDQNVYTARNNLPTIAPPTIAPESGQITDEDSVEPTEIDTTDNQDIPLISDDDTVEPNEGDQNSPEESDDTNETPDPDTQEPAVAPEPEPVVEPGPEIIPPTPEPIVTAQSLETAPLSNFNIGAITDNGIQITAEGTEVDQIFNVEDMDARRAGLQIMSFPYVYNSNVTGKVYVIGRRIEATPEEAFTTLYNALDAITLADEESGKNVSARFNTIGQENFYYNDPVNASDTVFLVVKQGKQVLAFEHPRVYHAAVKEVVPLFFLPQ